LYTKRNFFYNVSKFYNVVSIWIFFYNFILKLFNFLITFYSFITFNTLYNYIYSLTILKPNFRVDLTQFCLFFFVFFTLYLLLTFFFLMSSQIVTSEKILTRIFLLKFFSLQARFWKNLFWRIVKIFTLRSRYFEFFCFFFVCFFVFCFFFVCFFFFFFFFVFFVFFLSNFHMSLFLTVCLRFLLTIIVMLHFLVRALPFFSLLTRPHYGMRNGEWWRWGHYFILSHFPPYDFLCLFHQWFWKEMDKIMNIPHYSISLLPVFHLNNGAVGLIFSHFPTLCLF